MGATLRIVASRVSPSLRWWDPDGRGGRG